MHAYICEFIGVAMMLTLIEGVVANVTLKKSAMKGAGKLQATIACGLAVMIPAFIFGNASGAHFNPAVTLALAADGSFPWAQVPGYIIAQFLGAFAGAVNVWLMFGDQFDATEDPEVVFGCFSTSPAVRDIPRNLFSEAMITFILMFSIKGIEQVPGLAPGLSNVYVGAIVCACGMSLGGVTGFAINPARDLGPRVAHALLPIKGKGSCHWDYALVPIVGPIVGALAAVLVYALVF